MPASALGGGMRDENSETAQGTSRQRRPRHDPDRERQESVLVLDPGVMAHMAATSKASWAKLRCWERSEWPRKWGEAIRAVALIDTPAVRCVVSGTSHENRICA